MSRPTDDELRAIALLARTADTMSANWASIPVQPNRSIITPLRDSIPLPCWRPSGMSLLRPDVNVSGLLQPMITRRLYVFIKRRAFYW